MAEELAQLLNVISPLLVQCMSFLFILQSNNKRRRRKKKWKN